jgi:DNA (cytosine-5)-methyltransferase 1
MVQLPYPKRTLERFQTADYVVASQLMSLDKGPNKVTELTYVSLFSGCGGLDYGFHQQGFKCIGAYDSDPVAVEHHRTNLNSPVELLDLAAGDIGRVRMKKPLVVLAGPPCQGFSTVGKRSLNDPRNKLLLLAGEIALKISPLVFVAENVTGVTAGEHRKFWDELETLFRTQNYRTVTLKCRAEKLGLAQVRTRMLLIAWRHRECAIELPDLGTSTLRDALKGVENCHNHVPKRLAPGSDLSKIASKIGTGQKLSNVRGGFRAVHTWQIPEVYGPTTSSEKQVLEALLRVRRRDRVRENGDADPVHTGIVSQYLGRSAFSDLQSLKQKGYVRRIGNLYDLAHTFNGKFRRLSWDAPSLTVDTRFGDPRYFLHPSENRGFTVREAARIQGFPDSFIFSGNERDQYRLIGNAVPPPIANCLAVEIRNALLG